MSINITQELKKLPKWAWGVIGIGVVAVIGAFSFTSRKDDGMYYMPYSVPPASNDEGLGGARYFDFEILSALDSLSLTQSQLAEGQMVLYDTLGMLEDIVLSRDARDHSNLLDRISEEIRRSAPVASAPSPSSSSSKDSDRLVTVNQGVEGRSVQESVSSVEARQKERYDAAAARGDTVWMDIVKKETEAATGRAVDW